MSEQKTLDVVGIGNAIVDVLVQADDAVIEGFGLTRGTMALIDQDQAETLYAKLGPGLETSGGSAANTLAGIAQLGGRAGFIGRIRDDQLGPRSQVDLKALAQTHLSSGR
ncbi:MAG: adenosine kinase, partial [Novosphingobium sp.]